MQCIAPVQHRVIYDDGAQLLRARCENVLCWCSHQQYSDACPGIRKGQNLRALFFCFLIFQGGGAAQKIAEKMIIQNIGEIA